MIRRLAHHGLLERTRFVEALPPPPGGGSAKQRAGRACFASHLEAMRLALGDPAAEREGLIVCEDDVLFRDGFADSLGTLLGGLPAGAPQCLLGYMLGAGWEADFEWAGPDGLCTVVPGRLWGSFLYWVGAGRARELLARWHGTPVEQLPDSVEHALFQPVMHAACPPLSLSDAIDSTIRPPDERELHVEGQRMWPYSEYRGGEAGDERSPLRRFAAPCRPTIGLCMIVRDEAAVIGRCIDSVLGLIDCWTICDTGSADATREIVAERLAGLPGTLHEVPWRDFGRNRTELMALARGSADYLLLLDADMTLRVRGPLPPLSADAYLLRHDEDPGYAVPRLVRGDMTWRFVGSTHEYLAADAPHRQQLLEALVVEHHGDGGRRHEKLERDRALLEDELRRDPGNARGLFYLAQTCRDMGEQRRAVELYRRRAAMGGWDEEAYYAAYQAGALLARAGDPAAADALEEARRMRPQRAEAAIELVRLLRLRGEHAEAYPLARRAAELPRPDDILFVEEWVHAWGARFELAMCAYWSGRRDEAREELEALLAEGRLPPAAEAAVLEALRYCGNGRARPVASGVPPGLDDLCPSAETLPVELEVPWGWPGFNPSIAADGDGFRMIVRTANYRMADGGYRSLTDPGVVRTVNVLAQLDSELQVVSWEPVLERDHRTPALPGPVRGFEDCRLVRVGESWFAVAAVRDRNPAWRCEMALLALDGAGTAQAQVLEGPVPGRDEKNWMPFVLDGALHLLYGCGPTVVLRHDPDAARTVVVSSRGGPAGADGFRGGSQGLAVSDGWLFVVHEARPGPLGRLYTHRFVLLGEDLEIQAVSPPFRLARPGIEFCAGLARAGDRLVLSFGADDEKASLATVDADEALGLLEPVRLRGGRPSSAARG